MWVQSMYFGFVQTSFAIQYCWWLKMPDLRKTLAQLCGSAVIFDRTDLELHLKFSLTWLCQHSCHENSIRLGYWLSIRKAYDCALNEWLIKFERVESNLTKYTSCGHKNLQICQSVYKFDFPKKPRTHLIIKFYLKCFPKLMPHYNVS